MKGQVEKLMKYLRKGKTLAFSAAKAKISENTARKYAKCGKYPSTISVMHDWKTRKDPLADIWEKIESMLEINPGLQAKTIFHEFFGMNPPASDNGKLRTLQRRMRAWRIKKGLPKEVMFEQVHEPGKLCESDFTEMNSLGITILEKPFKHLVFHFVLTFSNWEIGQICFTESFESLADGLQNALFELGYIPEMHRTDQMTAAVNNMSEPRQFTEKYQSLLRHFKMKGQHIQAGKANENGDIEQRHHRFKQAVDQALMLRKSRDFASIGEYRDFLAALFKQLNAHRQEKLLLEIKKMKPLPSSLFPIATSLKVRVSQWSTIRVSKNVYSVSSSLIRHEIEARILPDTIEIWYGSDKVEEFPRLRGEGNKRIDYRHVIDSLIRKPGAFEEWKYRDELFPSTNFRLAYDFLKARDDARAVPKYLKLLYMAKYNGEEKVNTAIQILINGNLEPHPDTVKKMVQINVPESPSYMTTVAPVDLMEYDGKLRNGAI